MLSEYIRNLAFWTLDSLKGGHVKKQLVQLEKDMTTDYKVNFQEKEDSILAYALDHVPYYSNMKKDSVLSDFPVVNKKIIKENYDKFQSDEFADKKVQILRTSGSTGQPFEIRQDPQKRNRCYAEMMYFWGLTGYSIGQRYIYYRTWNSKNKKNAISAFARNIKMRDIVKFNKECLDIEEKYISSDKKIKMILGYASTLENLGKYLAEKGCTPNMFGVNSVIAISEALSDEAKNNLEKVFGSNVVSHYSNSENGVLAQWSEEENGFLINTSSFHIELLKFDKDEPVEDGESGRVVLTDFYNHSMPFIRYDTGDVARAEINKNGKRILKVIEGRKIDFISSTNGEVISPHEISVLFWNYSEVYHYQFVQTGKKNYTIKIVNDEFSRQEEMINDFKRLLGNDSEIVIDIVKDIPLAKSGKRKYIENQYV